MAQRIRREKKDKVTIYDVAREAGVAISTVSRVLNNSSDVSDETRQRVLRAIEKLQFRPDRTARTLAQKKTRVLAVAVTSFTTPFHNEILKGVRTALENVDADLLLSDLGSKYPQQKLLNFLRRGAVDGLLLIGLPPDEKLTLELRALHAPVVMVGYHHTDFDCFYWDDRTGARIAVQHLIACGHRRIGMIRSHTEGSLQLDRIAGYREALEAADIPYDPELVRAGKTEKHAGFSEEAGYEAMQELLDITPRVTAVFASSDVQALGAWKALREAGLRVPEDVALVGYDDIKTSEYVGLSSVSQNMHTVGKESARLLVERVEGLRQDPPLEVLVIPQLKVRYTSDCRQRA